MPDLRHQFHKELQKRLDFAVLVLPGKAFRIVLGTESLLIHRVEQDAAASMFTQAGNIVAMSETGRATCQHIADEVSQLAAPLLLKHDDVPVEMTDYADGVARWEFCKSLVPQLHCKTCVASGGFVTGVLGGPNGTAGDTVKIMPAPMHLMVKVDGETWQMGICVCPDCKVGLWSFRHVAKGKS